jgi:hypothetical protein
MAVVGVFRGDLVKSGHIMQVMVRKRIYIREIALPRSDDVSMPLGYDGPLFYQEFPVTHNIQEVVIFVTDLDEFIGVTYGALKDIPYGPFEIGGKSHIYVLAMIVLR